MRRALLFTAIAAALLAACSTGATTSVGPASEALRGTGGDAAKLAAAPVGNPNPGLPVPAAFNPDRALILTANIAMRAKDPWTVADRAQSIAVSLGGDVLGLNQSGKGDERSATLTLRVPSARFNDALRQLKELDGEVVSSSVDGKDVTDQFVDLQARLSAKQSEEQRYLALLARAEKIDDILKIDQALASVRTQIEQLTGQINSIKSRTEFSTITMSVTPLPGPIGTTGVGWDPAKTFAKALAALTALFQIVGDVAIWMVVFGWVPLLALAFVVAASRARRPTLPTA